MNLYQLRYFVTLAKEEHYTNAALQLHITQPSLTHAIHSMEDELGVRLFERKGRNVILTKYGKIFLKEVESVLEHLDDSIEMIKDIGQGREMLNIGFVRRLGISYIPRLISSFKNENISFQCHTGFSYNLIERLKKHQLDLVFCSYVDDEEIEFIPVVDRVFYIIVSLEHPLAQYDEIDLKEIEKLPFIAFAKSSGIRPMIDHILEDKKIHPSITMEIEEDEVVGGFVGYNLGVAIVPDMAVFDLLPVKKIKIKNLKDKQIFYMAYLKEREKSKAFLEFVDYVKGKKNDY